MFPSIARAKDIDEIERSSSSISLITNGQTRTLIYRYPQNEGKDKLQEFITKDSMDIEMIAILLPEDATPIEVRSGRTSDPPEIFSKNRVGFYPARGQESSRQLRLSYWVPSTEGQKSFTELIAKISGALFVPLITVLLANRPNAALIRRRRWIIFGGLFLQGLALLAIVYLSYRSQGELLISNLTEVLVGVAAGLGTVALWWTGEKIPTA